MFAYILMVKVDPNSLQFLSFLSVKMSQNVDPIYDFCVVGSGLFGSSCAKYAAQDGSTILIGPSEESKGKVKTCATFRGALSSIL